VENLVLDFEGLETRVVAIDRQAPSPSLVKKRRVKADEDNRGRRGTYNNVGLDIERKNRTKIETWNSNWNLE
jgi:hypothetical protein